MCFGRYTFPSILLIDGASIHFNDNGGIRTGAGMATMVKASRRAIAAIRRGHPWVYSEPEIRGALGEVVVVCDDAKQPVGWGIIDEGTIALRILGRGTACDMSATLMDRVARADRFRLRLLPEDTDTYRVIFGAGDGLPDLVVDRYGDVAVLRLYAKAWEPWLPQIVKALRKLYWVRTVYRRFGVRRVDGKQGGETLFGAEPEDVMVVIEAGIRQLVRVKEGQKTGLFLDQREHRMLVRRWASGRMVVNTFAYTGGFSLSAAMGGAAHVTTVDSAPGAIEDAKENFRLNGLDPADHAFVVADVFSWRPTTPVDLLIIDPPALTRSKESDGRALRAYVKLHRDLGGSVVRDGLLATASCTARLDAKSWRDAVAEGLCRNGDWSWLWSSQEPPDHPTSLVHEEAQYLKFGILRRR